MSTTQYETYARNSGKTKEEVNDAYDFVIKNYGKYLKTPEHIWWQVCNRLKIKVDPPAKEKKGNAKQAKQIGWRDLKLISNKDSVNVEGVVTWVAHDPGDPGNLERPERFKIGLLDKTGRGKVSCKHQEVLPLLMQQNPKPGDFVRVTNGYGWVMDAPELKSGERRGVSITKYTQVQVLKNFDPFSYFPAASSEGLQQNDTCVLQGIVLSSKVVMFKACLHDENGRVCGKGGMKDSDECFNGHPANGNWGEAPNTFLTLHDEHGAYEVQVEGQQNYDGQEILVVGQNVIKKDQSTQIRAIQITVKSAVDTGSAVLKRDTAKQGIMKTLRSFKRFPHESTLGRIMEELGSKSKVEADAVLQELVSEGKVRVEGTYVHYVKD